jgi:GntR family transcriptional repressor for pyruvate dehydrogenase complex
MKLLMADIVSGAKASGEKLPREVDIAEEYEVSRGVARETIRALEERGLISVKHGRGATINSPDRWDELDPDVMAALFESDSRDEILTQTLECWSILAEATAGLAAARASTESISRIWDALLRMEKHAESAKPGRNGDFRAAERDFYDALLDTSGNRVLRRLVEQIQSALLMADHAPPAPPADWGRTQYGKIAAAVGSSKPDEAREAMRALLARGEPA